jgi:hypothetical protein
MKFFLSVAILLGLVSYANATEQGYYFFFFDPDNPNQQGYDICSYVENQGPEQPFLEHGLVKAVTEGPYGSPSGEYNIVAQGLNTLAIYMANDRRKNTRQYQYFLTAGSGGAFQGSKGRYMIAVSSQPPPQKRGDARGEAKLGGYTIVETGFLHITFNGGSCN